MAVVSKTFCLGKLLVCLGWLLQIYRHTHTHIAKADFKLTVYVASLRQPKSPASTSGVHRLLECATMPGLPPCPLMKNKKIQKIITDKKQT